MPGTASSGGRNRKSARQHRLEGTYQKTRHAAAATDAPPDRRPTRPSKLRGQALAEWNRMVLRLEVTHTLATVDDAALYQYCCLFAETEGIIVAKRENAALAKTLLKAVAEMHAQLNRIAAADRATESTTIVDVGDLTAVVAQITALKKLDQKATTQLRQGHIAIRSYLVEFGMTPAARSRVKTPPPEATDPFAEFDDPAAEGPTH